MTVADIPSKANDYYQEHARLLAESFSRYTGKSLVNSDGNHSIAEELFYAPYAVISHGIEDDPVFNYANQYALNLFEMTWHGFVLLPSRESAEQDVQVERDRLLKTVAEKGFIDDYSGVRISSTGKRFRIINATVWNIYDENKYYGQAACINNWQYLD